MTTTLTILQGNTWVDNFWLPLLIVIVVAIGGYSFSKMRKKIKIIINYDYSFWTTFEDDHYNVFNLTIINRNDIDINSLTFASTPTHTLKDNIWSLPTGYQDRSETLLMGGMTQIQNSFGDKPISIKAHDRITGNLIFESPKPNCSITKIIATHLDKDINISVDRIRINQHNIHK
jgi:hypothetical protein